MEVEVVDAKTKKTLAKVGDLMPSSTIGELKETFEHYRPNLYPDRQSYRTEPRGKALKDDQTLKSLGISSGGKLFFKDLGPQVGWTTVFLTEYAGPLIIYGLFYLRPAIIYGADAKTHPYSQVVHIACGCWTFHYAKRLLETVFVHRFSHGTMPIANIFKNSIYYWGFAAFVAYFVNHPQYTCPAFEDLQIYSGLAGFILCELGNFSIHVALRNLRPAGSKTRMIPYATSNPFTWLFTVVSCPNYTYEVGAWVSFTIMTQCLPAGIFAFAGFYQMMIWAKGKHRNYVKEFRDYPIANAANVYFTDARAWRILSEQGMKWPKKKW